MRRIAVNHNFTNFWFPAGPNPNFHTHWSEPFPFAAWNPSEAVFSRFCILFLLVPSMVCKLGQRRIQWEFVNWMNFELERKINIVCNSVLRLENNLNDIVIEPGTKNSTNINVNANFLDFDSMPIRHITKKNIMWHWQFSLLELATFWNALKIETESF